MNLFSWQITVFSDLIRSIKLRTSTMLMSGTSGVGKTFIAKSVEDFLNHGGSQENLDETKIIYITGNEKLKFNDYYVFRSKFDEELSKNRTAKSELIKGGLREGLKAIPYAGDLISWISESINDKYFDKRSNLLDNQANEIMAVLSRLTGKKDLVLIFDDISSYDQSSTNLIKHLVLGSLKENFTFLKTSSILLIFNDENDDEFSNWIKTQWNNIKKFEMVPPRSNDIRLILERFDYKNLNQIHTETIETIFNLTGGNLEIIKQMVLVLNKANSSFESTISMESNSGTKQMFNNILESRLKLLGADGSLIDELLSTASMIGLNFSLYELEFITSKDSNKIKEIIKCSNDAMLTENIKETSYKFTHSIIKMVFQHRAGSNKADYCRKIERCLKKMKPDEYFLRAMYLFDAGDYEDSLVVYLLGYFKCLRNKVDMDKSIYPRLSYLLRDNHLKNYYNKMTSAYNKFQKYDFSGCIYQLRTIDEVIRTELNIEKDYLLAVASKKLYSLNPALNMSKNRLEWVFKNKELGETELWCRCASCLMALYYDCYHDLDKAFDIYRELIAFYSNRKGFDPMAEYNISILLRKSKILNASDLASNDTKKSVEYFKNTSYVSQYRRSLCNHMGNLITLGEYNEAFEYVKTDYRNLLIDAEYYIVNNIILSGAYSKKIKIDDGIMIYKSLLNKELEADDLFIIKNNLSVLYAISGNLNDARAVLEEIVTDKRIKVDDYFDYFISMNLASVLYLIGEKENAVKIMINYRDKIPYICINEKDFLQKRYDYLVDLFSSEIIVNSSKFDTYLINKYPYTLGQAWKHWGRGFLTSDIQYWSES